MTVTFLRQDAPPSDAAACLPVDTALIRLARPTVPFYRYLYNTVGAPYLWWLRRVTSDDKLGAYLAEPRVSIHVLYQDGEPAGFFELEHRTGIALPTVNISYFGLLPHMVGRGLGPAFLRAAIDTSWSFRPRGVTVNTCTADHPRALPTYLRAGFTPLRSVQEVWDIPDRLGLTIPDRLRL